MNQNIISLLNIQFDEFPFMKSESVSLAEIEEAEQILNVHFISDYKNFVSLYGGAIVGPFPIYGLRHAEPMDDNLWSVIDVTNHYRNEKWPQGSIMYIVSSDHSGNPIGISNKGGVIMFDHDTNEEIKIANDFEGFIKLCLES